MCLIEREIRMVDGMVTEGYAINWIPVLVVGVVGGTAVIFLFAASRLLAPRRSSELKDTPYECGIPAAPYAWSQIQIRYYIFALLFIIFDVEAVFLFPWAIVFLDAPPAVFYEMIMFIGVLFFGILYAWRRKVLEWR